MIGHLLSGRYELRRLLGRGGMARVYEAWDATLGRRVAVKLVDDRIADDPSLVDRFLREARASALLAHPNVVAVHDAGRHGDLHFIVMELIEGRSIAELLRGGPLSPNQAATVAAKVCLALEHAHRHGVIHRDVKPGNILLTSDGEVKITDFGIARLATSPGITDPGAVSGTAEYLAPEQAAGGAVDGRADLYALGCCLYEMLTGSPPFGRVGDTDGDTVLTALTIALRHLREAPVPPHRRRLGVPAALDRVVMRALAKQPNSRQQSAEELARDLDRFAGRSPAFPVAAPAPAGDTAVPTPGASAPVGTGVARPAATTTAGWATTGGAAIGRTGPAGPHAATPILAPRTMPPILEGRAVPPITALQLPAPSGPAPSGPAPSGPAPLAANPRGRGAPPIPAFPASFRPPAGRARPAGTVAPRGRAAQRRYAILAGLAAVALLAAGGTIAALAPSDPRQQDDAAALSGPPALASPAPTTAPAAATSTVTSTTVASTTTGPVSTTTRAGTTTGPTVGNPSVVVPNVVGLEADAAAIQLAQQKLGTTVLAGSTRRRPQLGEVLSQEPSAGTRVPQGSTVTIVVAMVLDRDGST